MSSVIFIYSGLHQSHRILAETITDHFFPSFTFQRSRIPIIKELDALVRSFSLPDADYYLCEGGTDLLCVWAKKIFNRKAKVVALVSSSYGLLHGSNVFSRCIGRFLLNATNGIITTSNMMMGLLKKNGVKTKIIVVRVPFLSKRFYGVKPALEKDVFLLVGRNDPEKGVSNFLRAVGGIDAEFLVVGRGFKHKKRGNVEFYPFTKELRQYLSRSAFYIQPSLFDPFGVAVLEAMTVGLIPLVSRNCGVAEYLIDNSLSDFVINDLRLECMREDINRVLKIPIEKREFIAEKMRNVAKKYATEFSKEKQKERFKDTFFSF